jgi:hypothetical protein
MLHWVFLRRTFVVCTVAALWLSALPVHTQQAPLYQGVILPMTPLLPCPGVPLECRATGIDDGQIVGYTQNLYAPTRALIWLDSGGSYTVNDLTPAGFGGAVAWAVNKGQQVGIGGGPATGGKDHALLWSGNGAVVDINPSSYDWSVARGVSDGRQAGFGSGVLTGNLVHALLWAGSPAVTDLHKFLPPSTLHNSLPTTFVASYAYGVSPNQVVGEGKVRYNGSDVSHAVVWTGNFGTDLHPSTGFTRSVAQGVSQDLQVGYGNPAAGGSHALLWKGSASGVLDLHPLLAATYSSFSSSQAAAISGDLVVGFTGGSAVHAVLWSISGGNVTDLHGFLPPFYTNSHAYGVDESGNVVGNASDAFGAVRAVVWKRNPNNPPPPPPVLASLTLNPTSIGYHFASTGTVMLTAPARQYLGGEVVTLTSSNPAVATVPPSVTVPAGAQNASFTAVATGSVTTPTNVTISATAGGMTLQATLTVLPTECAYSISPTSQSFPSGGGTGTVTVTTAGGCSWTATSNALWITVYSGRAGVGSGSVIYSVSPNSSPLGRTGKMTIAGLTFTVAQLSLPGRR